MQRNHNLYTLYKLLSNLLIKASHTGYHSPRLMISNLGLHTTRIFRISTSYGAEKADIRADGWQRWRLKPTYDVVDIPNIRIVRRPKFEVIIRRGSYPEYKAYIERLEVVPQA